MPSSGDDTDRDGPVRERFTADQSRSLSDAVLEAIETYKGTDLRSTDLVLYDNIDPDALDALFREGADANTVLMFDSDGVRVKLWGDGAIIIEVTEQVEL